MPQARRVVLESPLRGEVERNVLYADACQLDALRRGEAPFAGHLLYPRVLNDDLTSDREQGIAAHLAWITVADALVVYTDLGITDGMRKAISFAASLGMDVEYRKLGVQWRERLNDAHATPGFFH